MNMLNETVSLKLNFKSFNFSTECNPKCGNEIRKSKGTIVLGRPKDSHCTWTIVVSKTRGVTFRISALRVAQINRNTCHDSYLKVGVSAPTVKSTIFFVVKLNYTKEQIFNREFDKHAICQTTQELIHENKGFLRKCGWIIILWCVLYCNYTAF